MATINFELWNSSRPVSTSSHLQIVDNEGITYPRFIDRQIFERILECDGADAFKYYLDSADETMKRILDELKSRNPDTKSISLLAYRLKGSSEGLGILKVWESAEKIQHFSQSRDWPDGMNLLDESDAMKRLRMTIPELQKHFSEAKAWLNEVDRKVGRSDSIFDLYSRL